MTEDTKVKGPASYLPSIEKKYGYPITHWLSLLGTISGKKHMEMVAWLKTEHGIGHGHANALVAHYLALLKTPNNYSTQIVRFAHWDRLKPAL